MRRKERKRRRTGRRTRKAITALHGSVKGLKDGTRWKRKTTQGIGSLYEKEKEKKLEEGESGHQKKRKGFVGKKRL